MQEGQIYIPMINRWMFIFSVLLVLAFQTSDRMGATYGLAVTGVMLTSTIMLTLVARRAWGWSWFVIIPLLAGFFAIDLAFLGSNLLKVPHGGWVPLVIGLFMILVMTTWLRGSRLAYETRTEDSLPLSDFIQSAIDNEQPRIPGCGVFFTAQPDMTPNSLMKFNRHMPVLPEQVIVVHVHLASKPRVPKSERVQMEEKGGGFWQLNCSLELHAGSLSPQDAQAGEQSGVARESLRRSPTTSGVICLEGSRASHVRVAGILLRHVEERQRSDRSAEPSVGPGHGNRSSAEFLSRCSEEMHAGSSSRICSTMSWMSTRI